MTDENKVEFVDDREREYFARARLGIDVETFLNSSTGRFLHGRARMEIEECKNDMLDCNPNSWLGRRKLTKLQQRAATARLFMAWCAEAIIDGRLAHKELENNY